MHGHNKLLESLPAEDRARLSSLLSPIDLPIRTCLFSAEATPRYVHFILSGVASLVTNMEGGEVIEVGLVGREGFAEKFQVLGPLRGATECFMQVAGTGLRMDLKRFQAEFLHSPALLGRVHEYVQHDALVMAQIGACNRLHEVEARLARWLLMVRDRVGTPDLRITQEFLGNMLGVRRSSVSLAANTLQQRGIIQYSRGRVQLRDQPALEAAACECYGIIGKLYRNLFHA